MKSKHRLCVVRLVSRNFSAEEIGIFVNPQNQRAENDFLRNFSRTKVSNE